MKIKVLLALTAMSFLFCACPQVDPDPDPVEPDFGETEELVMVKEFRFGEDWSIGYGFEYDSQGRLNRIYGGNQILAHIYYEDNIVNLMSEVWGNHTFELDAKGRVIMAHPFFEPYVLDIVH